MTKIVKNLNENNETVVRLCPVWIPFDFGENASPSILRRRVDTR